MTHVSYTGDLAKENRKIGAQQKSYQIQYGYFSLRCFHFFAVQKKSNKWNEMQILRCCFLRKISLWDFLYHLIHNASILLVFDILLSYLETFVSSLGAGTLFLDATSHLYKRVCPSVRPSVRWSVRRSVTPSLRRLLVASYAEYPALFYLLSSHNQKKKCLAKKVCDDIALSK